MIFGGFNKNINYVKKVDKIGRNEKCICGSGKKFKKCCIGLYDKITSCRLVCPSSHSKEYVDKILTGEVNKKYCSTGWEVNQFNDCSDVKFVTHFDNLPQDLQNKLRLIFKYNSITMGGCYVNSLMISTLLDGVEKVDGFVSTGDLNQKMEKVKDLGNGIWECKEIYESDFQKEYSNDSGFGEEQDYTFIWDENTNKRYIKHSWNKYGDIHFDITIKIDWWGYGNFNYWMDYKELKSFQITDQKERDLCYGYTEWYNVLNTSKCKVRNHGLLDKKFFDNCQGGMISGSGYLSDGKYRNTEVFSDENYSSFSEYQNNLLNMEVIS